MSNLTNRSKLFLKKKKAQYGDFIRDSISYIDPNVFQQKPFYSKQEKPEESSFVDSLPLIGSIGQIIGGVAGIFEGNKKRRIQQIFDDASRDDLKQRREQARVNNFYLTPYAVGRTDNLTAKKGMKVPFYQNGGQMDLFMDFYNQQEQRSKMLEEQISESYRDKNEKLSQDASNTKRDAFGNIIGGITGLLGFQTGGIAPESTFIKSAPANKLDYMLISDRVKREDARAEFFGRENPAKIDPLQQAYIKNTIMPNVEAYKDYKKEMYGADSQKLTALRDRNLQQRKHRDNWVRERQEGGEIEVPDTESLYSPDFQSPVEDQGFSENEIQNFLTSTSPGEEMQKNSNLLSWLFEEEPLDTHTINDIYHSTYGNTNENVSVNISKGDIATTHSNPGNIKFGKFAQKYGAQPGRKATDGGVFALFPSVEAGLQAQKDLLTSGSYSNLTVADAMKRWSNSGYGADLYPQIANKKMRDLTSQELNELILRQTKRESPTIYKQIYK